MKQLLIDHTPFHIAKMTISEAKTSGDGRMRITGKLQESGVKNGNGRVYPPEVLKKQVELYTKGPIASNTAMGELDHPESTIVNLNNVSHVINKVWWEGNDVMGMLTLLNTPSGKIAQEIILAGIPLGISSRGMGSVKQIGETVRELGLAGEQQKKGTPTMGGIIILLSILIDGSLWCNFWWKDKDYSDGKLTADPTRNIFIQVMQHKKYQNFDVQTLTSPVVSLWNLNNSIDRTKTRIESEIYFNNAYLNYESIMFENVGHFMHLDKKVADCILLKIKTYLL